ncbi:MAG TPA: translocation/assembly module TamB domain-containing protein [Caldimonas sp.]|nr:translocation/assembly module TamB domain-containing protein [Caldimonas sp.]
MSADTDVATTPSGGADRPPPRRRGRRALRWAGGTLAALVLVVVAAIAALLWALHDAGGSAWLLGRVPQLTVVGPRGSLIGDFAAERIEIAFPGSGVLRLDAPSWHALAASRGDRGRWLKLRIATLHADRVTWVAAAAAPPGEPARPPATLRVPVEVEVDAATVDELRIGNDDAVPLRMLRARVHVGADGGARHRLDDVALVRDRVRASGRATIDADAPLAVSAQASFVGGDGAPLPWQASLTASGPLDRLDVAAVARVAPTRAGAPQSLDARAVVRPFSAWPLGELHASTEALDLAVFANDLPTTSLSGSAVITTTGADQPAVVEAHLVNARAGRWNEGRLPVQSVDATLRARPDAAGVVDVETLRAALGAADRPGGRIAARGRWAGDAWNVAADLDGVRPAALDGRAPQATLAGTLTLAGSGFAKAPDQHVIDAVAQLAGSFADPRLPKNAPHAARLRGEARIAANAIEIRSVEATLGRAHASGAAKLVRSAADRPWRASGKLRLVDFDPLPWWPGRTDSPLAHGTNRVNADAEFDVALAAAPGDRAWLDTLAATRGSSELRIHDSVLGGVPVEGSASFANPDGNARMALDVAVAGNRASGHGQLGAAGADHWEIAIDAPALDRLSPWLGTRGKGLQGTFSAKARVDGRWPTLQSAGELHGSGLRVDALTLRSAEGRWRGGSSRDAALDAELSLDGIDLGGRAIDHAALRVAGSARAHRADVRIESAALPPAWADAIAARAPASTTIASAPAPASSPAPAASTAKSTTRSVVVASVEGGLVDSGNVRNAGWRGTLHELVARSSGAPARTWLQARELRGSVVWGDGPTRVDVEPGALQALGATVRWSRVAWQAGATAASAGRLDAHAVVEPLPVAPLLQTLEPDFGWGGDLSVGARIDVKSAPNVVVDVAVERAGGDLTVTEGTTTTALGFTELRVGIAAHEGVWRFTAAVDGSAVGTGSASITARTTSAATWPTPSTPIDGVVELNVPRLSTWGTWLPAGWRLDGELHADARLQGRFGAPTYTGRLEGSHIAVRNFLQGVNISDGTVAIALEGSTAHIETFTAKAGSGTVRLEGNATFGDSPVAQLTLVAERFQMLGRVDRRIVASGRAAMRLDATTVALDGSFKVDEGLVDFTRSDAPTLGDDVQVVRRPRAKPSTDEPEPPPPVVAPVARRVALDLHVDMGEQLRVRGHGLDTGVRGELRLTSPGSKLAVDGTLRAVGGTYQAYGQKLVIDRGLLAFAGPVENPRLDIEATRPNLDVRVGAQITGTALAPRVRLFSEPEMSDVDKLSWLITGHASEAGDAATTALLQQAALGLLSGEGPGATDRIVKSLGFDQIGVRQGPTPGDTKDTIVTLGKQISQRWYVGYERGLNATAGSWKLIYRVARRVSVSAQAGEDNAIDLHWILRWK